MIQSDNLRTGPKVLYIMGTARSGSTILEVMLSKGAGCFGAGEISSLIQDGFIEDKECSCGHSCKSCEVWGRVQKSLTAVGSYFQTWSILQKKIEWHDGLIRQVFGVLKESDSQQYREWNQGLLNTIQQVTGAEVVLDSSKYAGRALALKRIVGADVMVICLTRAPEGLMHSFQKANKLEQKPKKPFSALVYYLIALISLRLAIVLVGRPHVFMLRYEELIADPEGVIREIGNWSRIDFEDVLLRLREGREFEVGHVVTGNRLRKEEAVHFQTMKDRRVNYCIGAKVTVAMMNCWRRILRF